MEKIDIESFFGSKLQIKIGPYPQDPEMVTLMINESGYIIQKEEIEKLYHFIQQTA